MATYESDDPVLEPIVFPDEPIRSSARSSASRNKGAESAAFWGTVALIGAVVGIYVLVKPPQPAPVIEPEPIAAPVASTSERAPKRSRPVPKRANAPAASTSTVTVHEQPERKVVDPIQGFDTNEAFDNPPSPGRYGQRRSGQYPTTTNPPAARPNRPDPSFGTPQ